MTVHPCPVCDYRTIQRECTYCGVEQSEGWHTFPLSAPMRRDIHLHLSVCHECHVKLDATELLTSYLRGSLRR